MSPSGPPLVLVDPPADPFWPLAATRPVAGLLAGTRTFRTRWSNRLGEPAALLCDPAVAGAGADASEAPRRNRWPDTSGGWRVGLSTWIPSAGDPFGDEPAELRLEGRPVGWRLGPHEAAEVTRAEESAEACRDRLAALGLPAREVHGLVVGSIWETMATNGDIVRLDAGEFAGGDALSAVDPIVLLGEAGELRVGPDASVGPFTLLDTRDGPIVLDRGVRVESHAVVRGPTYVGTDSVILGGEVRGASIGPRCKIRGELEKTIVQGYANKAHDGFVGHSVLGEWVNLGADTVTSDLKNTYGPVRVEGPDGRTDTGMTKVGAFLGDHVRTGIGTLLTTGARIGVGTHLFGGRAVSPARLPHFSWYDGRERVPVRWEPFVRSVETAMARRDRELGEGDRAILAALHAEGA